MGTKVTNHSIKSDILPHTKNLQAICTPKNVEILKESSQTNLSTVPIDGIVNNIQINATQEPREYMTFKDMSWRTRILLGGGLSLMITAMTPSTIDLIKEGQPIYRESIIELLGLMAGATLLFGGALPSNKKDEEDWMTKNQERYEENRQNLYRALEAINQYETNTDTSNHQI